MYEYELKTGERHGNVELLTVRGEQVVETEVVFGGRVNESGMALAARQSVLTPSARRRLARRSGSGCSRT
jgi:hypothetical protein